MKPLWRRDTRHWALSLNPLKVALYEEEETDQNLTKTLLVCTGIGQHIQWAYQMLGPRVQRCPAPDGWLGIWEYFPGAIPMTCQTHLGYLQLLPVVGPAGALSQNVPFLYQAAASQLTTPPPPKTCRNRRAESLPFRGGTLHSDEICPAINRNR